MMLANAPAGLAGEKVTRLVPLRVVHVLGAVFLPRWRW
jgi:putative Ca2+/H+ antiporter (TMEM165/GDT1 family)